MSGGERVSVWQCIGCGRLEAPQPCIGVCQDRKVEFVDAADYEALRAELARLRGEARALGTLVRQLAHTTPREGDCERTYRALQQRARRTLERFAAAPNSAADSPLPV